MKKYSLRKKLVVIFLIIGIAPAAIIAVFSTLQFREALTRAAFGNLVALISGTTEETGRKK